MAGTVEVPEQHQFDTDAVGRYMAVHVTDFTPGPLRARKFGVGQSNPTFLLEDAGGRKYVMRKKPPGRLLKSAHAVDREYRVMTALGPTDVPVPRTYCLCDDPGVIGTTFYIMEYLPGRVFTRGTLPDLSPDERRQIYMELFRVLALLHTVDYKTIGLGDYGPTGKYLTRQVRRWGGQYEDMVKEMPKERSEAMDSLLGYLRHRLPEMEANDVTTLVHGDFKLDNMMFHPSEPRIIAVLDWELSTLGHPMSDLAYLSLPWYTPVGTTLSAVQGCDVTGIPGTEELQRWYCEVAAVVHPISGWTFYMALSFFRLAAIGYGVYVRGIKGNASSPLALTAGDYARDSAKWGWDLVTAAKPAAL